MRLVWKIDWIAILDLDPSNSRTYNVFLVFDIFFTYLPGSRYGISLSSHMLLSVFFSLTFEIFL